jgi:hypothetical protein
MKLCRMFEPRDSVQAQDYHCGLYFGKSVPIYQTSGFTSLKTLIIMNSTDPITLRFTYFQFLCICVYMLRLLKKLKDQPPSRLPVVLCFLFWYTSCIPLSSCIHTDDSNDSCVITLPGNKSFGLVDKSQEV